MFQRKPKGRRLYHFPDLQDGQRVEGYAGSDRRRFRNGYIVRETERWMADEDFLTNIYVCYPTRYGEIRERLMYRWSTRDKWEGGISTFELYQISLIRENQSMANKLMALVRLNKNQRKLQKVGIYDENGNLTADGTEVLLNMIAGEYETKLVDLVKDWKDTKKKSDKDEDDD